MLPSIATGNSSGAVSRFWFATSAGLGVVVQVSDDHESNGAPASRFLGLGRGACGTQHAASKAEPFVTLLDWSSGSLPMKLAITLEKISPFCGISAGNFVTVNSPPSPCLGSAGSPMHYRPRYAGFVHSKLLVCWHANEVGKSNRSTYDLGAHVSGNHDKRSGKPVNESVFGRAQFRIAHGL